MTFLSPSFMFLFLPVALAFYAMAPKLRRVDLLPMISSVFFVCVNIHDLWSLAYYFAIVICSAVILKLYKKDKKRSRLILLQILAAGAAIFAVLYRFIFVGKAIYHAGLLICLMAVISMCSDIIRNEGRAPDTVWEAMIYITFFPVMLAGPVVRYGDFIEKLDKISFSIENFINGILRFLLGFVKCVAVSAVLGYVYDGVIALNGSFGLLVYVFIATLGGVRIYTFFSGYSDIGRGIALMLGIDIKKDFKDPFVSVTPADYLKGFFRSISEFAKIYIVEPIDRLFSHSTLGKLVACVLTGCYYVFVLCSTSEAAIVLCIPACALSYFIMFRPKEKRLKLPLPIKIVAALATFFVMSLVWSYVTIEQISDFPTVMKSVLDNPVTYAAHDVKKILMNLKYIAIPTASGVLVFAISRITEAEKESTGDISVGDLIVRSVAMTVLALLFIVAVVLLLPQFPDVISYANFFHFM